MKRPLLAGALLFFVSFAALAATMPPVRMKVVDAQDGSPVAGALVIFYAKAREGTWTGHGGKYATLWVAEAATDAAGEVRFPKQDFSRQPFFLNTNYESPTMVILKPGYVLLALVHSASTSPDLDELTSWPYQDQTVKLKRRATEADIAESADLAASYANGPVSSTHLCAWKSVPRFLVAADRLAAEWNRMRKATTDPAYRYRVVMSPLEKITGNEAFFVEKGCGSPKAFFEPYLRPGKALGGP